MKLEVSAGYIWYQEADSPINNLIGNSHSHTEKEWSEIARIIKVYSEIEKELFEMRKGNSHSAMTANTLCQKYFPQRFAKRKNIKD